LDFPVGKINGREHTSLRIALNVLPNFPFLHDSPKSAIFLTSDCLSHIGQFLLAEYFLVCYLDRLNLLWQELT
jgi:hypothetical protein